MDEGERKILEETIDALGMPIKGVIHWMRADRQFCDAHGGRRVYGELLDLFDEMDASLAEHGTKR